MYRIKHSALFRAVERGCLHSSVMCQGIVYVQSRILVFGHVSNKEDETEVVPL